VFSAAQKRLAAAVQDGLGERDISALIGDMRSRTAIGGIDETRRSE
jgi:hypothetical protein